MKLKYILLSLLLTIPVYCQVPQVLTMWDKQPGGLNTTKLPMNLSQYQFAQMNNVYTDDDNGVKQCEGIYSIWNDTQTNIRFHKEYTKTDGSRYLVFVSSNHLNYAYTGGAFNTLISTISLTGTIWGVQYNNRFYIGDSDGDSWYFDGSKVVCSTQVPQGKYAVTAYGILFIANQTNLNSKVSYSMIDDFMTFDPLYYFLISKDDGEDITGMFQFRGDVYLTKRHSLHKLLNIDDNTNVGDSWITISREVGCVDGRSIQELNNSMYWLSENGVVLFDGTGFTMLSTDIKPTIANMSEIKSGVKYDVITTSADFATGTFSTFISTTSNDSLTIIVSSEINQTADKAFVTAYDNSMNTTNWQTFQSSYNGCVTGVRVSGKYTGATAATFAVIRGGNLTNGATSNTLNTPNDGSGKEYEYKFTDLYISSGTTYELCLKSTSGIGYWGWKTSSVYSRGSAYTNSAIDTGDYMFTLYMFQSTQTYISPVRNMTTLGITWKQWQSIGITDSNISDTKYYIKTATAPFSLLNAVSWTAVSADSVISSTSGAYYQWMAIINSTNTAYTLNDVTISYYASNPSTTLSSGIDIANQRYLLGYTELPATVPNKVLVWQDRNKSFTMLSGFNPTSMGYYKNDFYIGTLDGKINRFSYDYTTFNGTSINPYIKTGDFDFGARIMDKYYKELWLSYEPTTVYSNSTVDIYINRSTWAVVSFNYSLAADPYAPSNSVDGKVYKNVGRFKNVAFKISNFTQFNGLDLIYSMEPRR